MKHYQEDWPCTRSQALGRCVLKAGFVALRGAGIARAVHPKMSPELGGIDARKPVGGAEQHGLCARQRDEPVTDVVWGSHVVLGSTVLLRGSNVEWGSSSGATAESTGVLVNGDN